jgi:hypothetical protein
VIPVDDFPSVRLDGGSGETRGGAVEAAAMAGDGTSEGERGRRSSSIAMVLPAHLLFATPAVDPQAPG